MAGSKLALRVKVVLSNRKRSNSVPSKPEVCRKDRFLVVDPLPSDSAVYGKESRACVYKISSDASTSTFSETTSLEVLHFLLLRVEDDLHTDGFESGCTDENKIRSWF
jgi:hypothetical protein